ncbi:MAG: hypothetical protein V4726_15240 [Verrucomicrobiota bacterium]
MKFLSLLAAGAFLLGSMPWLEARTFTAADGRTLEGDITDAGDTEVTIRRTADKRLFKLRIETLSKEDQKEIVGWRTRKALARITLTATKSKLESRKHSVGGSNQIADAKAQNWCWRITVKNGSNLPVTGLQLKYNQIVERTDRNQGAASGAAKTTARTGSGTLTVPDIGPFGSVTLETDGIPVTAYKSTNISRSTTTSGDSVTNITTYKWDEALSGIGVNLLLGTDSVMEWKTGTNPGIPR